MDLGIEGRTALVLGAGGGLGSAVSLALAREGVRVVAADISEPALEKTAQALGQAGHPVHATVWNLADGHEAAAGQLARIEQAAGPIDILFNNTGGPAPSRASAFDAQALQAAFEAMVASVMGITSLVLPGMRQRGWGRVITSTSSGVVAPIPNLALSNSLRLALVGWSKTLAQEVAKDGVTVNVVVPGRIETARVRYLDEVKARDQGTDPAAVAAASTAGIPVGRYGEPAEYADAVAFLASARAAYITGAQLRVDGGLLANI